MRAALFPYVLRHGEQCHGVDGRPGESSPAGVSWCVLCSHRSGFEGGRVAVGRPAAVVGRFEGAVDGGPVRGTVAIMATSCPRAPQQRRDVTTVPGVVQQWRGWPHRADSDGMIDLAGLTSRHGPA
jgi:hypothetical protein